MEGWGAGPPGLPSDGARESCPRMWAYLAVFLCALASDTVPVIGPPGWMIMVIFWTQFDLNPWLVLACGVPGTVLGRYLFSLYVPRLSARFLKRRKTDEIAFLGRKLDRNLGRSWLFVFLYALTPLSTTALFMAVGLGRVRARQVVPPFFAGKFVIDAVLLFSGRYAVRSITELLHGTVSWKGLVVTAAGLAFMAVLLFVDWRTLMDQRKLRFAFRIWK